MRVVLFFFILALNATTLSAQPAPEWYRVYTFDDSTIEMNTALVTSISKDVSRVRFRWTFSEPQSLHELKFQSELEVMELNCSERKYRRYHVTFFDSAGNIVRLNDSPGEWRRVPAGGMIEKLFVPGCELIRKRSIAGPAADNEEQLEKVALFALDFGHQLEKARDFKPLIDRYFIANYLDGYLNDQQTNWFLNLSRETASSLSRDELQRFYVSLMNAGYLSSLYLISRIPPDSEGPASAEKLLPPDVLHLLRNHPYTTQYGPREGDFDFREEKIGSVERLRSYTDLLERVNALLKEHVQRIKAAQSKEWQAMLEDWDLYNPKVRVCGKNCFGLPGGTELFEVNVPVFRLQVAEVNGTLKVVSATSLY